MKKDAFYFPHFSNARTDRKIRRMRKELGIEGYGIYFMLLEVLRDQEEFKYPIEDIDLLAEEFGTSENKVQIVIANYGLFEKDHEENFFSIKFNEFMLPYIEGKELKRIAGIKGNLIKYKHLTKEQISEMSNSEIINFNNHIKSEGGRLPLALREHTDSDTISNASQSKVNESKEKESKEKESKKDSSFFVLISSKVGRSEKLDFDTFKEKFKAKEEAILISQRRTNKNFTVDAFNKILNQFFVDKTLITFESQNHFFHTLSIYVNANSVNVVNTVKAKDEDQFGYA